MVGGGLQRACASTFRRLMPRSQGSDETEGSVVRGRGLGRGKGGPKGRGRGRPRRRAEEEEQQYEPEEEEEEEEDDTVASAESSGGEGDDEEEGEGEDATQDDSTPAVWLRGPSRLPDRPIPLGLRPLIRPSGPR